MSYCSECGHNNSDVAKFCANCGLSLKEPETSGPEQKIEQAPRESQQVKNSVWQSAYYCLFEDRDPTSISKNLLILIAANIGVTIALNQILWPKTDESPDLGIIFFVFAAVYGVLFLLIRLATKKNSTVWLYPVLALYGFAIFTTFDQDSQQKLSFLLSSHPQWGGITHLWALALGLWDLILGTIVETILVVRLFIRIKAEQ